MKKKQFTFTVIAVFVMLGMLLPGCTNKQEISEPSTIANNIDLTGEPTYDSNGLYFTMDDFASIVIGESTLKDVINITTESYHLFWTGSGCLIEYPMKNGKCICVEYKMNPEQQDWKDWEECFVVQDITIAEPIKKTHSTTDSAIHFQGPIGFSDYDNYVAFFRDPDSMKTVSEIYTSVDIKTYIQDVRDGKLPLMIPCIENEPMALKEYDHPFASPVNVSYNLFAGSNFITLIGETEVFLYIYALYEEDAAMAKEMTCPELINVLKPTMTNILKFNVGQFNYTGYDAVFEDTAVIAGESRTMLVQQGKDGTEWIYFVIDGCIIETCAPTGTVTKDWLQNFSIVAH